MDSFGNGAFGIHIDGASPTIRWIAISWGSSLFLVQCIIAMVAYYQISDHGRINPYLKSLFLISVLSAWSGTMADLIGNIIMLQSGAYPNACTQIYAQSTGFFFVAMLATLVLRLYMTFQHSIYRMSKTLTYIFITIFALSFVLSVVGAILLVLYPDSPEKIAYGTGIPFFLMFFIGTALAVTFFVRNLAKLAKTRADSASMRNVVDIKEDDIKLNEQQQRLSDLCARYILLYFMATFSTNLCYFVLALTINVDSQFRNVFYSVDYCVNLICLYLQFGFAQAHYHQCCGCLDRPCKRFLSRRAKKSILKSYTASEIGITSLSDSASPSPKSPSNLVTTSGVICASDSDLAT